MSFFWTKKAIKTKQGTSCSLACLIISGTKSLLKKIGLGLSPIVTLSPIAFVTSCSNSKGIYTNYLTFENVLENESFAKCNKENLKPNDVLLGSNKFSDGNYILIVGCNSYQASGDVSEYYSIIKRFLGNFANKENKHVDH